MRRGSLLAVAVAVLYVQGCHHPALIEQDLHTEIQAGSCDVCSSSMECIVCVDMYPSFDVGEHRYCTQRGYTYTWKEGKWTL